MPKEARKRRILSLLDDSGLALPPRVIYNNLASRGITFGEKTVKRLLNEMVDEGLVEKSDVGKGYYRITEAGREDLEDSD